MTSRTEKEKTLVSALTTALAELGFKPDTPVPWGSVDASYWFSRMRDRMTEAVACRLKWEPEDEEEEEFMMVDCVASAYSLPDLARRGLEENAAGLNLFNYQVIFLERDAEDLLPQSVSLKSDGDDWAEFVRSLSDRIAFELASIDTQIWPELRKS